MQWPNLVVIFFVFFVTHANISVMTVAEFHWEAGEIQLILKGTIQILRNQDFDLF